MANKITKREIITNLMNGTMSTTDSIAQEFFAHELELLDKKASKRKSASEKDENIEFANKIIEVLTNSTEAMSTTEIGNAIGVSTSKATSLLKMLIADNKVVREKVKGKPMFELA